MRGGNRIVKHCGIVAVQSKRTKKIVLYINNERVLKVSADCIFKEQDLVRLIDRHKIYLRGGES